MLNPGKDLNFHAEPFVVGEDVSDGNPKYIRMVFEETEQGMLQERLQHDLPVRDYDQMMIEIMVEMFYARNKADLIEKGEDNPHQKAKETTKEVLTLMMENIESEFDPKKVDKILESKRAVGQTVIGAGTPEEE